MTEAQGVPIPAPDPKKAGPMKQALLDLFTSKKFLVTLASILLAITSKLGLHLDPDLVNQVLAMAAVFVVGQGIADHGKEAARITAISDAVVSSQPARVIASIKAAP